MQTLSSYVQSKWIAGTADETPLYNPATEQPIARIRGGGIDMRAVVDHAREKGGPGLRALSFKERGALVKALANALHEKREELIAVSIENGGSTRGDAKFDVDGAIGTLSAYAALAEKLPATAFLPD